MHAQAFGLLKGRFRCLKMLRVALGRVPEVVTACVVLHNICIDTSDSWHAPVRLQTPVFDRGTHRAGTVPTSASVGPDGDRGTRRPPKWHLRHPNPKYRWDAYNPSDTRPLEVQHRVNVNAQRARLLDHVKGCRKCRLFGGRVHL